jgi:mannose-binding lectin 2
LEAKLTYSQARGLRSAPIPTKARLTYFQDKSLSLELQYKTEDSWTECFNLSAENSNIAIPSVAYLGLSAETGELSDNHDIISLKAENLYSLNRNANNGGKGSSGNQAKGRSSSPAKAPKEPKEKGSWTWFLFKTVLFFGVIVGGYFGWTIYRTKARSSRF